MKSSSQPKLLVNGSFLGPQKVTAVRHRGTAVAFGTLADTDTDGGQRYEFVASAAEGSATHEKLTVVTRRLAGYSGVAQLRARKVRVE